MLQTPSLGNDALAIDSSPWHRQLVWMIGIHFLVGGSVSLSQLALNIVAVILALAVVIGPDEED